MITEQPSLELAPEQAGERPQKQLAPFSTFEDQAKAIVAEAAGIVVTDATQVTLIKRSKELRLKAKHTRCALENFRKEKVEGLVKETKAINTDANKIKDVLETLESKLLENEQFAERAEAARITALRESRELELKPVSVVDVKLLNLGMMADDQYATLLADSNAAHESRVAAAAKQKAEAEAKAKIEALRYERAGILAPFRGRGFLESEVLDLGTMTEDDFASVLKRGQEGEAEEKRKLEAQRVENERLALALDREHAIRRCTLATGVARPPDLASLSADEFEALKAEMIRAHNAEADRQQAEVEKAAAEKAAREAAAQKEREEAAAKLKAQEDAAEAERVKSAAALKKQQDEAAALARAAQAKADAEAKRLREEAAERERVAAEKAKAEAEMARKEREAIHAELKEKEEAMKARMLADAQARDRAEAELAAKKAAEAKAAADKLAAERAAAAAPDKEKLTAFAKTVRALALPKLDASRAKLADTLLGQVERFAEWIELQAETL